MPVFRETVEHQVVLVYDFDSWVYESYPQIQEYLTAHQMTYRIIEVVRRYGPEWWVRVREKTSEGNHEVVDFYPVGDADRAYAKWKDAARRAFRSKQRFPKGGPCWSKQRWRRTDTLRATVILAQDNMFHQLAQQYTAVGEKSFAANHNQS